MSKPEKMKYTTEEMKLLMIDTIKNLEDDSWEDSLYPAAVAFKILVNKYCDIISFCERHENELDDMNPKVVKKLLRIIKKKDEMKELCNGYDINKQFGHYEDDEMLHNK
jgi:hypothetical protein